jgi:heme exporter protein CcmD
MNVIMNFLNMGGYAFYVWTAYGSVIALLFLMWLMPWRRWQRYINE